MANGDAVQAQGPVIDIYARISVALTGETIKTDDQIEMGTENITARGARVGKVFRDDSLSAWKPNVVREAWERMMRRIEGRESDGVWVLDTTRFSRKIIEGERLVEAAQSGARVWSASGGYDLTTADGRRHFREAMVAAAGESDKISERVRRGKVRRARRGKTPGGQRGYAMPGYEPKPDGWEPGDPRTPIPDEVVEAEREIVRECYRRLLAGESTSSVVRDLYARGLRGLQGKPWSIHSLTAMLRRPAVAGLLAHNGEVVGTLAGVEPIVSEEEWARLCGLFDARRRGRPAGRVHVLSGLIFCECGQKMFGRPRKSTVPYPDGTPRREYRCRTGWDGHGCGRNFVDALVLESAVAVAVKETLGDPDRAERLAARAAMVKQERGRILAEIDRWDEMGDNLAEKTARWGEERVDKAMVPILRRINALKAELAALDEPESPRGAAQDVAREWDEAAAAGDFDTMRSMVKAALPRMAVTRPIGWNDHRPERFDWRGKVLDALKTA